jgi:organic radical activating enzyme
MLIPNSQRPEKKVIAETLEVHSIFATIQGEGPFSGCPAIFIRLAGCNLQCPGCDTDYTSNRESLTCDEILAKVKDCLNDEFATNLVVITGGEPFRQNLTGLLNVLLYRGFRVQIETNGTLPPSPQMPTNNVIIVVSPKTGTVHKDIHALASCYKYVLDPRKNNIASDGLPKIVLGHSNDGMVARPLTPRAIYVQPADVGDDFANTIIRDKVVKLSMKHGYILQLQIHKILGLE